MHALAATGSRSMSCPQTETWPWDGAMKPAIILMVVVLPAPLAPKKPNTSPGDTLNVRSSTASLSPYRLDKFFVVIMGAFERSSAKEVQIFLARLFADRSASYGLGAPTLASMADLFSLSIRRTSGSEGRSAMRAISSGNSYHLRPHCTKRAASAMTCAHAASEGPLRSAGAAGATLETGLTAGFKAGAGFKTGAGFAVAPSRGG